jgi:RNA polymerase sigma-70 factor, ECF subfamily
MARAACGDVDAFALVYDRHAPTVLAWLRRLLRDRGDAQDLLHDVFIEAWQRSRDYDPTRASVRGWLLVRARARAIDRLRRLERERAAPAHLEAPAAPAAERHYALHEALATLEPNLREALELTYFEGLTAAEVSLRVHMPEGTVRSRLARGLACLHDVLGEPA